MPYQRKLQFNAKIIKRSNKARKRCEKERSSKEKLISKTSDQRSHRHSKRLHRLAHSQNFSLNFFRCKVGNHRCTRRPADSRNDNSKAYNGHHTNKSLLKREQKTKGGKGDEDNFQNFQGREPFQGEFTAKTRTQHPADPHKCRDIANIRRRKMKEVHQTHRSKLKEHVP